MCPLEHWTSRRHGSSRRWEGLRWSHRRGGESSRRCGQAGPAHPRQVIARSDRFRIEDRRSSVDLGVGPISIARSNRSRNVAHTPAAIARKRSLTAISLTRTPRPRPGVGSQPSISKPKDAITHPALSIEGSQPTLQPRASTSRALRSDALARSHRSSVGGPSRRGCDPIVTARRSHRDDHSPDWAPKTPRQEPD